MKSKFIFIPVSVLVFLLLSGLSGPAIQAQDQNGQAPVTEYRLVIKQIEDEWRVVHQDDDTKSDVTVRRGDRIRWIVEGSDASFQFMDEKLVGHSTRRMRDGQPLVLAIGNEARKGVHPYVVFIHKDETFARGQSPPNIIVE